MRNFLLSYHKTTKDLLENKGIKFCYEWKTDVESPDYATGCNFIVGGNTQAGRNFQGYRQFIIRTSKSSGGYYGNIVGC